MKIGILTFHWATNYGAVLQCYALQTYLESLGHTVKVINYKPLQYEETIYKFFRYRKFLRIRVFISTLRKERELSLFRRRNLNMTELVRTCSCVGKLASQFDLIISGSDQVANPFFLKNGEGKNLITPTYFLGFPFNGKRIGYAMSFGCTNYPEDAKMIAAPFIKGFDAISVREKTGIDIIRSMGRNDAIFAPDPTFLMDSGFYHTLADSSKATLQLPFVYSFFIRNVGDMKSSLKKIDFGERCVIWNNEDGDYSMQGWLSKIKQADFVITDSFHCVVMCLMFHRQFLIVTEKDGNVGMNDRVYTLLSPLDLDDRILCRTNLNSSSLSVINEVNWVSIDNQLSHFSQIGKEYLKTI